MFVQTDKARLHSVGARWSQQSAPRTLGVLALSSLTLGCQPTSTLPDARQHLDTDAGHSLDGGIPTDGAPADAFPIDGPMTDGSSSNDGGLDVLYPGPYATFAVDASGEWLFALTVEDFRSATLEALPLAGGTQRTADVSDEVAYSLVGLDGCVFYTEYGGTVYRWCVQASEDTQPEPIANVTGLASELRFDGKRPWVLSTTGVYAIGDSGLTDVRRDFEGVPVGASDGLYWIGESGSLTRTDHQGTDEDLSVMVQDLYAATGSIEQLFLLTESELLSYEQRSATVSVLADSIEGAGPIFADEKAIYWCDRLAASVWTYSFAEASVRLLASDVGCPAMQLASEGLLVTTVDGIALLPL